MILDHVQGVDSRTGCSILLGWHSRTRWPFHRALGKRDSLEAAFSMQVTAGSAQCWRQGSVPCCQVGICEDDGISSVPCLPLPWHLCRSAQLATVCVWLMLCPSGRCSFLPGYSQNLAAAIKIPQDRLTRGRGELRTSVPVPFIRGHALQ